MPRSIKVRFNESEIRAFLNDPLGPVAHLLEELGGRAAVFARAKVHKRTSGSPGASGKPGSSAPPGATAASIASALHAPGDQLPWEEISGGWATFYLEKGTKRHWIEALGPYSLSNKATGYFGPAVSHPGARPYPFLTEGLWSLQGQV
jgi:hypothetical protein